nr:hypothetical protein [Bacillus sp. UNC41MFS5]
MFGGGVQNANHLLIQVLSTLHDANGKVYVDHFLRCCCGANEI